MLTSLEDLAVLVDGVDFDRVLNQFLAVHFINYFGSALLNEPN